MSIILMILLLSVLILVHEAGHFLAAKMFKMKVAKFGFGLPIGPTLWEKKIGDVTVLVHAFLLGGYVAFPDDEKDETLPADSPDRFLNRPVYQRLIVVSAGVIANVICAFVLVFLTAALWGQLPSGKYTVTVKNKKKKKSEAIWKSGLQKGDRIVEINGSEINTPYGLMAFAKLSSKFDGKANGAYIGENTEKLKRLNPAFKADEIIPEDVMVQIPSVGTEPQIKLNRDQIIGIEKYKDDELPLSDAQKKLRDEIEGRKYFLSDGTITLNDVAYAISDNVHPINITVERNGEIVKLNPVYSNKDGLIGVEYCANEIIIPTKDFKSIVSGSNKYLYDNTYMLLYGLKQIFTGKVPLNDLHGVILITKIGGDKIQDEGIFSGILLAALISLDLAIVNFLPIPALDGGHVLFLIIEKLRGRPLEEEIIEKIGTAGFLFLIALMVFVIFNDIYALITHKI